MFFLALAYAPWAYGATTAIAIQITDWLIGAALVLWVAELLVNGRKPIFPKTLFILVVMLLAIGGWMVLNARAFYDPEFQIFSPIGNLISHGPGSVDYPISAAWLIRGALLLGTVLFIADLSHDDSALLQVGYAVAVIAGSISLLGLLQKATGAHMIFWQSAREGDLSTFFASYYYHANAGAYLNLVLPLSAGLALRAFNTPTTPVGRGVLLTIFVANLGAVAANTSRMAQLVGALLFLALLLRFGPRVIREFSIGELKIALIGAAAVLFTLFAIAGASHLEQPLKRWEAISQTLPNDARWLAGRVAIAALPHVGLFGWGPGTFRVAFPIYNSASLHRAPGSWRFLHEDYLQTLMEWGWLGSALWGLLFFGGIAVAVRALSAQTKFRKRNAQRSTPQGGGPPSQVTSRRSDVRIEDAEQQRQNQRSKIKNRKSPLWSPRRRLMLPLCVVALAGVSLHALVDFPLQIYSIQLYVATYLGICWGSAVWKSAS